MSRTAQISKEKRQAITTLRHEGQSIQNISRTLKVSSSAVAKTKRYDETGSHEDLHRKGRPIVISAAEDKFIRVTSLRNCSPNKCFRVQVTETSTSTFQKRLRESGLHGWIVAKKPLLKDTNKMRIDWAKKHKRKTGGNLSFGSMSPNLRLLAPTAVWDALWVNGWSLYVYFPP